MLKLIELLRKGLQGRAEARKNRFFFNLQLLRLILKSDVCASIEESSAIQLLLWLQTPLGDKCLTVIE